MAIIHGKASQGINGGIETISILKVQMGAFRIATGTYEPQKQALPYRLVFSDQYFTAVGIKGFKRIMIDDHSPSIAALPACEVHCATLSRTYGGALVGTDVNALMQPSTALAITPGYDAINWPNEGIVALIDYGPMSPTRTHIVEGKVLANPGGFEGIG